MDVWWCQWICRVFVGFGEGWIVGVWFVDLSCDLSGLESGLSDSESGEEHKGIFTEYYHLSFVYQHLGMLLISQFQEHF